jgi:hypothetical protein
MSTNDANATREQRRPLDVAPVAEKPERAYKESLATRSVQPSGAKE